MTLFEALIAAQKNSPHCEEQNGQYAEIFLLYADLESVVDAITPVLHKYGLVQYQTGAVLDNRQALITFIHHAESECSIDSTFLLPGIDPQDVGGAITFFRRYALCAALGIVTEDDTDGQQKAKPEPRKASQDDDIPPFMPPGESSRKAAPAGLGSFVCLYGSSKGKTFAQVGKPQLAKDLAYWNAKLEEPAKGKLKEFLDAAQAYLAE